MSRMSHLSRLWKAWQVRRRNRQVAAPAAETGVVGLMSPGVKEEHAIPREGNKDDAKVPANEKPSVHNGRAESTTSKRRVGFMDLPGEIRNKIYKYLPLCDTPQLVAWSSKKDISRGLLRSPIYRLNRQIRSEALSILCTDRSFTILENRALDLFLEAIGPSGRASLTHLTIIAIIEGGPSYNYKDHLFKSLLQLDLKYLCLELNFEPDGNLPRLKEQFIKWCRSFREVFLRDNETIEFRHGVHLGLEEVIRTVPDEARKLNHSYVVLMRETPYANEEDILNMIEKGEPWWDHTQL
ncbi:uncharacterized protein EI97DRAFT_428884 [Westerdykella ornata]|uniref:F-box domain-containing protein n=1 Tax=Westerdykella ornata TaxID=318751 RepID=A0A6A6JWJ3_WESOR|nr:uncharacterized protein EI97DRAFT_428884 [Westerdykella ornata]KAF2280777.1 hypothetical protein EI97DRAFT_428884 [Westerdykella ornata]